MTLILMCWVLYDRFAQAPSSSDAYEMIDDNRGVDPKIVLFTVTLISAFTPLPMHLSAIGKDLTRLKKQVSNFSS